MLECGPGIGFFILELARLLGISIRVIAVDVQPKMIDRLKRRAAKAGLLDRVTTRLASSESMGIKDLQGSVDFILAFSVVHELPDASRFFGEAAVALRPGATLLLAEPSGHVKAAEFDFELKAAAERVQHPSSPLHTAYPGCSVEEGRAANRSCRMPLMTGLASSWMRTAERDPEQAADRRPAGFQRLPVAYGVD